MEKKVRERRSKGVASVRTCALSRSAVGVKPLVKRKIHGDNSAQNKLSQISHVLFFPQFASDNYNTRNIRATETVQKLKTITKSSQNKFGRKKKEKSKTILEMRVHDSRFCNESEKKLVAR